MHNPLRVISKRIAPVQIITALVKYLETQVLGLSQAAEIATERADLDCQETFCPGAPETCHRDHMGLSVWPFWCLCVEASTGAFDQCDVVAL